MIDVSKLKHKWHAEWDFSHSYVRGDIVRFKDATYVCIQDIPLEFASDGSTMVSTSSYYSYAPGIHLKTKDPRDTSYWLQFTPGTKYMGIWKRNTLYKVGDIVDLAGDLYMCTKDSGNIRNLYPEINTDYFTLIFKTAERDRRLWPVSTLNEQPLGWKYNMGECFYGQQSWQPGMSFIDVEGVPNHGGYAALGFGGNNGNHTNRRIKAVPMSFTFAGWYASSDNNGGTGRLTTPDGRAPKCIQQVYGGGSNGLSLYLFNNGEVYSQGYNGHGQCGISTATDQVNARRVYATDTTDWLGNTIPYAFSDTRIKKVTISSSGCNESAQVCHAIDEFGGVWAWGYNSVPGTGLGNSAINNSTASGNIYTDNGSTYRPRRIPSSFFDDKRIVDIYSFGGSRPRVFAIDEDGDMWAWGTEYNGELGLGDWMGTDGPSYYLTPQRVPVQWNKYGGIQKFMWCGAASGGSQRLMVLDGQGKLWVTGTFNYGGSSQSLAAESGTSASNQGRLTSGRNVRWTRLTKGWFREHEVENFWIVGDKAWVLYIREKGTGFTYSMGHNGYGVLGQGSNHRYTYSSDSDGNAYSNEPGLVEGPVNVTQIVNCHTADPSTTAQSYMTINIVCEDGSLWGAGRNDYGGNGLGFLSMNYGEMSQNVYWASANLFRKNRYSDAPGNAITFLHPWGSGVRDACSFFNESAQVQIAGTDGDNDAGYDMWQGSFWPAQYYVNVTSNPGNYHVGHIHSYPMG